MTVFPGACITPWSRDGGSSGWPGGYCSDLCTGFPLDCGASGICGSDSRCYGACSPAGSGQADCRAGYVCDSDNGSGICVPDCHTPGVSCSTGTTCHSNGYCR